MSNKDITIGNGEQRKWRHISSLPCPVCNAFNTEPERVMAVVVFGDQDVQLECTNCAYTETRRSYDYYRLYPESRPYGK